MYLCVKFFLLRRLKDYPTGSSPADRQFVTDATREYKDNGYGQTTNMVTNIMVSDDFITYNGKQDLNIEDNAETRGKMYNNIQTYKRASKLIEQRQREEQIMQPVLANEDQRYLQKLREREQKLINSLSLRNKTSVHL